VTMGHALQLCVSPLLETINKLPSTRITEIICSAVEIEMEFIVDALPVELSGMYSCMICDHINYCADRLLLSLGCNRH
jgi:ribonucleotide reductase beta subunit family protein with ferritin-like domain